MQYSPIHQNSRETQDEGEEGKGDKTYTREKKYNKKTQKWEGGATNDTYSDIILLSFKG
jgi:hypothetical protein